MNNKSYSILTKDMINTSEHDESVPENCFCPVCNVHMNRIKRSRPLDTHQEHNAFSPDGIKERWCPMDRLQNLRTNLHQTMDHGSERLLKLNPYPILDTDPILDNLNYSNALSKSPHLLGNKKKDYTTQSMYEIEQNDRHNDVFQYNNSRLWEENENCVDQEEFKNIDQFNYSPIKKYDMHMRQPPVHRQRKILPTVPPKPLISTNCTHKIGCSSLTINGHLNNTNPKNKDLMDIPNQKTIVNHVRLATLMPVVSKETYKSMKHTKDTPKVKESLTITKEDEQIHEQSSSKPELILNSDIYEKSKSKLSDKNCKISNPKTRWQTDNINNTSVFSVNSLKTHVDLTSENTQTSLESPIVQPLNKKIEQDCMIDEPNKLAFDHLFSGTQKQNDYFEYHSALRPSLFSNMPPYIRFSSHDMKGESFPLSLQKLLKWKLSSITPIVVRRTIQNSGFKLVRKSNDWVGTWGKHMKSLCFKTLREQQKLNHFPGTFQIGRKDRLWKNLHRLMLKYGKEHFGFIPTSYILPQEARILRQVWEKNDEDKWIVKPPASARGTGIRVISKWGQIPKKVPLVVQRYIDNPYLINDTKFDLRLYILITSINPLRLYLYDNGLVRFASVKYSSDLTTLCDRYMHLTNYSINRLSSQYTQNEDADACQGHKWTLRSLWTYMEKERKIDVKKLWESLEDLVVKTVISGESPMSQMCRSNLSNRYNAYELFGIDVLFDEHLKPWILEVNISPSLHSSSPLDLAVKGPLVKDLMNMVGYHIPNKMSSSTHNNLLKMLGVKSPLCYDKRLYTFNLSAKEKEKQEYYTNVESRAEYIDSILDDLLPDDVRHLIIYEDELTQIGSFQKVFPTTSSFKYHQYFDGSRYYNMLFDAWECKYSNNRGEGIAVLEKLCQLKIHLEVPDIDEEQSKTCDIHQNTQMEVEKIGSDKLIDHHQAVISHFSMSAAERRHMVYTSITMSDEGDWISDDFPFDDDSTSATSHPMVS
ncbi:tubulin monoglutamylase TTLL4-like isoform X1 [Rhopalosiphum padi]|uniref:tubulin monoglutamylase TTLL4-like isoform X1 n=1 Tax=Rhopalosiphum padi TaxID=40932 RepID=UPI00298E3CB8|nr:tubulin monoglutamylase TTLL4-like isoform X1 [Rhopalosiphum padi]